MFDIVRVLLGYWLTLLLLLLICDKSAPLDCTLPDEWRYELTLTTWFKTDDDMKNSVPALSTDGAQLLDGKMVFVSCQISTWTFQNRFRSLKEHIALQDGTDKSGGAGSMWWGYHYNIKDEYITSVGDYIDALEVTDVTTDAYAYNTKPNGSIIVKCVNGIFNPDIFTNYKSWCAEGCPKVSKMWLTALSMDVEYPKGSLSLDNFKAPVQRLPNSLIEFSCHFGFTVTSGTSDYSNGTYCTSNGYSPLANTYSTYKKCKAGCEDPETAISNSQTTGKSDSANDDGAYDEGSLVTLACKSGYQIYGSGFRYCLYTKETWEDFYGQTSYEDKKGVYWEPSEKLMYCAPLSENMTTSGARANVPRGAVVMAMLCCCHAVVMLLSVDSHALGGIY